MADTLDKDGSSNVPDEQDQNAGPSDSRDDETNDTGISDDDDDDSVDEPVETLIAGRARRATAGRNMRALIQKHREQDEEAAQTSLNEDDDVDMIFEDAGEGSADEFEGVGEDEDADEDDDDSSAAEADEDEAAAATEELIGEKELKKQERVEQQSKKRKGVKSFARPQPMRKRVKIDGSAKDSLDATEKKRKKSERANWVPTKEDRPTRVSSRTLSVQNKSRTLASLEEGNKRAEVIRQKMKQSEMKKQAAKKVPMTQEERLAEAARVEKSNTKSVNRWEEMERDRVAKQKADLERLRNKKLEGPVIRWYSGPAVWDARGKLKRYGGASKIQVIENVETLDEPTQKLVKPKKKAPKPSSPNGASLDQAQSQAIDEAPAPPALDAASSSAHDSIQTQQPATNADSARLQDESAHQQTAPSTAVDETKQSSSVQANHASQDMPSFLAGIEHYATLDASPKQPPTMAEPSNAPVSAPSGDPPSEPPAHSASTAESSGAPQAQSQDVPQAAPISTDASTNLQPAPSPEPERPAAPAQAQTITLLNYNLDTQTKSTMPDALRRILLSTPTHRYPIHPAKLVAAKPTQPICAITTQPARYRDPVTGLGYRNREAFRILRGVVKGNEPGELGPRWSPLLGVWVGREGVAARGVPPGFLPNTRAVRRDEASASERPSDGATAAVKAEGDGV